MNLQKNEIVEKEFEKIDVVPTSNQEDQNLQNKHKKEINFDLNKNDEVYKSENNNFDLFQNENQTTNDKHQIDLTEIEREDEDIDEKVLEIPAFLRRQAN